MEGQQAISESSQNLTPASVQQRHSDPKVMAEISQLHSELLEGGYRKEENEKGDRLEVAQVADTPGQQRSLDETRSSTLTGSSLLIFDPQHNKDRRVSDSPGVRVGRPHESEIYQPYEDSTRFVTQSRHSNPQQQSRPQSNHMPEQARQSMGSMGAQIPGLGLMGQATTGSRRQLATPTRTGPQPHISGNGFATQLRPGFQGWELENDGDGTDPWGNFVEVLPGIGTGRLVEALQTQNPNPNLNPGQNALLQLVAHHLSGMTPQQLANLPPHQRKQWCQILENQQQQQALAQVQQQIQQQQQQQRQQRKQQAQQQQGQLGFNPGQDQQQQQSLGGQIPGLAQTEQSSGGFPGRQPPQQAENTVQGNGPDGPLFLDQIVNLPLEAFRNQLVTFKGKIKALEDQRDRLVQIKTPQALEQAQKFQLQVNGLNGVMQQLTEAFARRQATAMGLQPTQPGGQGVQQPSAMAGANQGSAQNRPGMGGQGPQDGLGGGGGGAQLPIGWPQNMPHLVQQLSRERMQALVNAGGVPAPNQSPQQQSMQQQPPEQQQPPPRALARL
ncbi:hypothetical protein FRC01_014726 [Tulasnella sp. 417]|nr:hypothetical protein FRC01_014726 [Tulasnella sp. 417]